MNPVRVAIGVSIGALLLLICTPVFIFGAVASACDATPTATVSASVSPATGPRWDTEQTTNATIIITVGTTRGIPVRGQIIALATAMQESNLRNLPYLGPDNDHDSIGLLQQRPSQGWGTPEQLQHPAYAAGKFYDKLLAIDGWQTMALTDAAQAVQRSAYPQAYAKWEDEATTLAAQLGAADPCMPPAAGGWMMPVNGPIVSGFRTAHRPRHDGIDIEAPKGTDIHAAAAGVVIKVACNASLGGRPYPCDQDGSPSVAGCGYYSEILTGNLVHRYCHQLVQPYVHVGETVTAGQVIGVVGTSGHSGGPHLHWEIHTGNPATSENAQDPAAFLRLMGVTVL